jgi:hypothetical protein
MNRPIKTLSSDSPVFDGYEAVVWVVNMSSRVDDAQVRNITPGVLYTIIIQQDGEGGRVFNWPSNCTNAPTVNLAPNGTTVANFIGMQDALSIFPNAPATWPSP